MTENRPWSEYQNLILKKLRQQNKIQKWNIIAQIMADQYNLKGRTAKQCKENYQSLFDQKNEVHDWNYQQQQKLFALHDQLGNKWAVIGQQLYNRTDNEVKNHFYSKLRKALRKLNKIVKQNYKKQFKQIKQNVLYKIIEGTQDKFKNHSIYDQDLWNFSFQLKNSLLKYSYDEIEYNPLQNFKNNQESVRYLIQCLIDFSKGYKRKPKKIRRASGHDLETLQEFAKLTIPVLQNRIRSTGNSPCGSQISDDQFSDNEEEQFSRKNINKLNSMFGLQFPVLQNKKQEVIILQSSNNNANKFGQNQNHKMQLKPDHKSCNSVFFQFGNLNVNNANQMIDQQDQKDFIQNQLKMNGLLEEQEEMYNPPHPSMMKRLASKNSNFSNYQIQQQQEHFFGQDSSLNMRIYTTCPGGIKTNLLDASIDKSDKLFKSIDKDKLLFQSFQSRRSDGLFQSSGRQ